MSGADHQQLLSALQNTLSPDKATRQQAESYLSNREKQPGYASLLLSILSSKSGNPLILQSCALVFKNYIKRIYSVAEEYENYKWSSPQEAAGCKGALVTFQCNVPVLKQTPPNVRKQISEAIRIIAEVDFPKKWDDLLPRLTQLLSESCSSNDFEIIQEGLSTINEVFKKFRKGFRSDALYAILKYCLDNFCEPLSAIFQHLLQQLQVTGSANNLKAKDVILRCLRLVSRIFYSLNWQDIPEYFEDHIDQYFTQGFLPLLKMPIAPVDPTMENESTPSGPTELCIAAALFNADLYANKYDEEFAKLLPTFVEAAWERLVGLSSGQKDSESGRVNIVATACMKFLTSVVSKPGNKSLFNPTMLSQMCEKVVVPNALLKESDEERFEDDPEEYMKRDGGATEMTICGLSSAESVETSRRSAACALLRGMVKVFPQQVSALTVQYIQNMLQSPDWKVRETAYVLAASVACTATIRGQGASRLSEHFDMGAFYENLVHKNLVALANLDWRKANQLDSLGSHELLLATTVKFAVTFRSFLTPNHLSTLFSACHCLLYQAKQHVLLTYAAGAIERILAMKPIKGANGQLMGSTFGKAEIAQSGKLNSLLEKLFKLVMDDAMSASALESLMRCAMRVIARADNLIDDKVAIVIFDILCAETGVLMKACKNPANPRLNHYLFETAAAVLKNQSRMKGTLSNMVGYFESKLFPPLQLLLQHNIGELMPYAFQLLAMLLEMRRMVMTELGPAYTALFAPLLTAELWTDRANVPGLKRLLGAYLRPPVGYNLDGTSALAQAASSCSINVVKQPHDGAVLVMPHLTACLGVFQNLLSSKLTDEPAISLLAGMIQGLPAHPSYGVNVVVQALNGLQPHLFFTLITQVIIPTLPLVSDKNFYVRSIGVSLEARSAPVKAVVMAGVAMLSNGAVLQNMLNTQQILPYLISLAQLIIQASPNGPGGQLKVGSKASGDEMKGSGQEDIVRDSGYTAGYTALSFARDIGTPLDIFGTCLPNATSPLAKICFNCDARIIGAALQKGAGGNAQVLQQIRQATMNTEASIFLA
eukprot:g2613.t1